MTTKTEPFIDYRHASKRASALIEGTVPEDHKEDVNLARAYLVMMAYHCSCDFKQDQILLRATPGDHHSGRCELRAFLQSKVLDR